jgi:micrococcal nuclease
MYEYKCELIKVVDGDTIDVLIDVGFSTFRKERGLKAKDRLKEILKSWGDNFVIKTEIDKKGKYGRILGMLYDKTLLNCANRMLVEEGHAVKYMT